MPCSHRTLEGPSSASSAAASSRRRCRRSPAARATIRPRPWPPWRGPEGGADLRRWALAYAILAPNSHNRQPWIADLRDPGAIVLRVDRERLLPETDPWFRQIVVSQGTFLESLAIALRQRGVEPEVTLFPEGEFAPRALDDRPVARVTWRSGVRVPARDPLFAQLLRRHTAKVDYDTTRPVSEATVAALRERRRRPGRSLRRDGRARPARRLASGLLDSALVEIRTPRTMMESLRLIRLGPDEIARHRDGISVNTLMPRLAAAVGAFDRSAPPAEGSGGYKQALARFEGHSRTAMGFVWLSTPRRMRPRVRAAARCAPAAPTCACS